MGQRCGGCCAVMSHRYCGTSIKRDKRILICGSQGSGKTSLLYNLHSGVRFETPKYPTKGYNYEMISFSPYKTYEFVDPGGSEIQQELWPLFTESVQFDYIIYVVNMRDYRNQDPDKRTGYFRKDRENLHWLAADQAKRPRSAQIIVYLNYDLIVDAAQKDRQEKNVLRAFLIDEIGLHVEIHERDAKGRGVNPDRKGKEKSGSKPGIPPENFVDTINYKERDENKREVTLLDLLDVDTERDEWNPFCFAGSGWDT
mmetsp:Transcript_8636/g.16729  ORF Transcript_8636/g.16729 Transcript_8636/m.16729 type:complete len:256 (+) Transcript_8636:61-828(+)